MDYRAAMLDGLRIAPSRVDWSAHHAGRRAQRDAGAMLRPAQHFDLVVAAGVQQEVEPSTGEIAQTQATQQQRIVQQCIARQPPPGQIGQRRPE